MFKLFLQSNSRSIFVISFFLILWVIVYSIQEPSQKEKVQNPHVNDVYILNNEHVFAPMRIDSISTTHIYMRNYLYFFSDAIPKKSQLLTNEFETAFFAIYTKEELLRLNATGKIVRIYRN